MSNVFSSSYPISRATGACAATGRTFSRGERYIAVLVNRAEELGRSDFSLEAWKAGSRPVGMFASWTTTFDPGITTGRQRLSDEEAAELFEQLSTPESPAQEAFRYILALFLVRRRLYVYEGSKDGIVTVRAWTRAGEAQAPVVEVREVPMNDEALMQALEQLKELIPDGAGQS